MHYIQKHILDELRMIDSARYVQLNKDGIESGHFRYHLSELVKDGYVEQLSRGLYALTIKGQKYVDTLSEHVVRPKTMPKVITYTLLLDGDNLLLYRKPKQPYKDLLSMIGGKVHEGETTKQAAIREVYEKVGVDIQDPVLKGMFEIRINREGQPFTHVIAYVYTASLDPASYTGESLTPVSKENLADITVLAPDVLPIVTQLATSDGVAVGPIELSI